MTNLKVKKKRKRNGQARKFMLSFIPYFWVKIKFYINDTSAQKKLCVRDVIQKKSR